MAASPKPPSAISFTARSSRAARKTSTTRRSSSAAPTWPPASGCSTRYVRRSSVRSECRSCSTRTDSNTTAAAAVAKLQQAAGDISGRRAVVTAGTGPVGVRAAGLLARAGADVVITSRRQPDPALIEKIQKRFGGTLSGVAMSDGSQAAQVLSGAELLLNAGPAGICLVPKTAWAGRAGLRAAADVNAVPPLGIEGIEVMDNGDRARRRDGVRRAWRGRIEDEDPQSVHRPVVRDKRSRPRRGGHCGCCE